MAAGNKERTASKSVHSAFLILKLESKSIWKNC